MELENVATGPNVEKIHLIQNIAHYHNYIWTMLPLWKCKMLPSGPDKVALKSCPGSSLPTLVWLTDRHFRILDRKSDFRHLIRTMSGQQDKKTEIRKDKDETESFL